MNSSGLPSLFRPFLPLSSESKSLRPSCLRLKATAHSLGIVAGIRPHHSADDSVGGTSSVSSENLRLKKGSTGRPLGAALAVDEPAAVETVLQSVDLRVMRFQTPQEKKGSTGPFRAPGPPVAAPAVDEHVVGVRVMRSVDPQRRQRYPAMQSFAGAHFAAAYTLEGVDSLEGHPYLMQMLGGPSLAVDTVETDVVVWPASACLIADYLCYQGLQSHC